MLECTPLACAGGSSIEDGVVPVLAGSLRTWVTFMGKTRKTILLWSPFAIVLFAIAAIWRYPAAPAILIARGLHFRSPYCSKLAVIRDANVKLKMLAQEEDIKAHSRILRREKGVALWQTPKGEWWVPDQGFEILPVLLAQNSRDAYGQGEWGPRRGDIVLDMGAYIGTTVRWELERGARLVVAVEPTPESVECLQRNLAKEIAAGRVIVVPKGIWDAEGTLALFEIPGQSEGNSLVPSSQAINGPTVPVTTIRVLTAGLHLPRVDYIKADVKGATTRMLQGGAEIIARDRPRLALSTEEPEDDPVQVTAAVRSIRGDYTVQCGPCLTTGHEVFTDVMLYR